MVNKRPAAAASAKHTAKRPAAAARIVVKRPAADRKVGVQARLLRILTDEYPAVSRARIVSAIEKSCVKEGRALQLGFKHAFEECFKLQWEISNLSARARTLHAINSANVTSLAERWKVADDVASVNSHVAHGSTLVAKRFFPAGQDIFCDTPLVVWDPDEEDSKLSDMFWLQPAEVQDHILSLFAGESEEERRMRGCLGFVGEGADPEDLLVKMISRLDRVAHYNGLPLSTVSSSQVNPSTGKATKFYGMFRLLCRATHSCKPVANFKPEGENGSQVITSLSEIEPGQEITISYLTEDELTWSTAKRKAWLQDIFGFSCDCQRCESES